MASGVTRIGKRFAVCLVFDTNVEISERSPAGCSENSDEHSEVSADLRVNGLEMRQNNILRRGFYEFPPFIDKFNGCDVRLISHGSLTDFS